MDKKLILRKRQRRGMTLVEITASVFVLGMAVATAIAMFSSSAMLRDRSTNYSRASNHMHQKLEQVRNLDSTAMTPQVLRAEGIVDDVAPTTGSSGEEIYTFTTVDDLASSLPQGQGKLTIQRTDTDLVWAEVEVRWVNFRGQQMSTTARTAVADKSAWREP